MIRSICLLKKLYCNSIRNGKFVVIPVARSLLAAMVICIYQPVITPLLSMHLSRQSQTTDLLHWIIAKVLNSMMREEVHRTAMIFAERSFASKYTMMALTAYPMEIYF